MTDKSNGAVFALKDMNAYPLNNEELSIVSIKEDGINGFRITPKHGKCTNGVIVEFGGSELGCNFFQATELAQLGYDVFALYYFGTENQSPLINMIELEFLERFIGLLKKKGISHTPLTIIGASRGAEFTLLLADKYPDIVNNIVLYAPTSYVFQGLGSSTLTSAWTFRGEEFPYILLDMAAWEAAQKDAQAGKLVNFRNVYQTCVNNAENREKAVIDVSHFKGEALLFAGGEDMVWQSEIMAKDVAERIGERATMKIYPNAGHLFIPSARIDTPFFSIHTGGTTSNNIAAKRGSDAILFDKLSKWH